jgi:hypothetical protein
MSSMPNLLSEPRKFLLETVFVSISTSWSSDLTKGKKITPSSRFCLMKFGLSRYALSSHAELDFEKLQLQFYYRSTGSFLTWE